jgi:hypothetical protein
MSSSPGVRLRSRSRLGRKESPGTFTQRKRREQLLGCAIDAIVDLGFQGMSVGADSSQLG